MNHRFAIYLCILFPIGLSCRIKDQFDERTKQGNHTTDNKDIDEEPEADGTAASPDKLRELLAKSFADLIDPSGRPNGKTPGLVVTLVTPKVSLVQGFGVTAVGSGKIPTGDTHFQIASVTKIFTGTILADAVISRDLSIDTSVNNLLKTDVQVPGNQGQAITLNHLVTHSSGLPTSANNMIDRDLNGQRDDDVLEYAPAKDYTRQDLINYLNQLEFTSSVDNNFRYSNIGISMLGVALADKYSFADYDHLLKEKLTSILEMDETGTNESGFLDRIQADVAQGYGLLDGKFSEVPFLDAGILAGSGEIISTGNDMVKFLGAATGLKQTMAEGFAEASKVLKTIGGDLQIGYAYRISKAKNGSLLFDKSGSNMGYTAFLLFSRDYKSGLMIMANKGQMGKVVQERALGFLEKYMAVVDGKSDSEEEQTSVCKKQTNQYGEDGEVGLLDVHTMGGSNHPVVVLVHGGGWRSGSRENFNNERIVSYFQSFGMIPVTVDFRLVDQGDFASQQTTYKEQAEDIAAAVGWVHKNIRDFGGDPDRIHLVGYSSGAHQVALITTDPRYLAGAAVPESAIESVTALDVVAYDIPRAIGNAVELGYPASAKSLPNLFGTELATQNDASPVFHLQAQSPKPEYLIVYADIKNDVRQTLSKDQSDHFVDQLKIAGTKAEAFRAIDKSHSDLVANLGSAQDPVSVKLTGFYEGLGMSTSGVDECADQKVEGEGGVAGGGQQLGIDFEKFKTLPIAEGKSEAKLREIFQRIDADGNGFITKSERDAAAAAA